MWNENRRDLSVQEVLDFVRTAYQVNEAVDGAAIKVEWNAVASNPLLARLRVEEERMLEIGPESVEEEVKIRRSSSLDGSRRRRAASEGPTHRQSSLEKQSGHSSGERKIADYRRIAGRRRSSLTMKKDPSVDVANKTAERYIKRKLNQVLQEGILDSVLPYILSKQSHKRAPQTFSQEPSVFPECKKLSSSSSEKSERNGVVFSKREIRRKSTSSIEGKLADKKDVEVVIHVCDEVKNMKRDFKCPQNLLISRMKYFAEVTPGQRLDEMDISVHCDVSIFDWLIRWVKQVGNPTLDSSIVIPVLMSSAFLQMDALQETCLEFCRTHINDVIRDSSNLGCINDSVLTRLANMFSNSEIEAIKDRKDKLVSKLYSKLIMFLTESAPQPRRGHYSSIAFLFRCSKCGKLISKNDAAQIPCIPKLITLNSNGQLMSKHQRDPTWSLTELVRQLKSDLKSWKRVYWALWGMCHHVNCSFCCSPFPLHQISWCFHHAEAAQFFAMEHQRSMSFPVGRYPCCGAKAFRFELLPLQSGCQQREHTPDIRTETDRAIMKIFKMHQELIRQDPADFNATALVDKDFLWWEGLELTLTKSRPGLLGSWIDALTKPGEKRTSSLSKSLRPPLPAPPSESSESSSDSLDFESSASGEDSGESYTAAVRVTTKPLSSLLNPLPRKEASHVWLAKLSTRCNQDNQREFEERAVRHMERLLTRKTCGDNLIFGQRASSAQDLPGGTYLRLEAEWREMHCSTHGCPGSSKLRLHPNKQKTKR